MIFVDELNPSTVLFVNISVYDSIHTCAAYDRFLLSGSLYVRNRNVCRFDEVALSFNGGKDSTVSFARQGSSAVFAAN